MQYWLGAHCSNLLSGVSDVQHDSSDQHHGLPSRRSSISSFVRGKRGRGTYGKTIVFGLLKKEGRVYSEIVLSGI